MVNPNSFLLPLTQITWIPQVRGAVVDVLESLTGVVQGCAVSTVHQVHKHYHCHILLYHLRRIFLEIRLAQGSRKVKISTCDFSPPGFLLAATNTCFPGSSP